MTAFSIAPVERNDLLVLSELLIASKLCLTVNRLLWKDWPNETAQRPNYTNAIRSGFESPHTDSFKAVNATGEILGFIAISQKQALNTEGRLNQKGQNEKEQVILNAMNPGVLQMVMKAVNEVDKEAVGKEHLELTYVYVKPSYRNQGIGSKLLQLGFDKAKAKALPIILGSEPEAHDFFIKLGFRDTTHADMDLSQWAPPRSGFGIFRLWGMVWEGQK